MVIDLIKENREIHGVDIAEEMVNIAKERLKKSGVISNKINIKVGDIEKLEFENNYFDLIICSGVIECLEDDVKWLKELAGHPLVSIGSHSQSHVRLTKCNRKELAN